MVPAPSPDTAAHAGPDYRRTQILAAQVQLLYENTRTAVGVSVIASAILAWAQWGSIPHLVVLGWSVYMLSVALARALLGRRYAHAAPSATDVGRWGARFALGAGLAGAGWGAAGILLYPEAQVANQLFLVFLVGGMMLG